MTVIIGIGDGKRVTMGCDSIAINPDTLQLTVRREPKLFRLGPHLIIGFSGSFEVGDAIKHGPAPPPPEAGVFEKEPETYIHDVLLPALRATVEEADVPESALDGNQLLVGFNGHVFLVEGLRQAGSSIDGVEACGAGDDLAIGAALALLETGMAAEEAVRGALAVAEARSAGVRGPFHVLAS